MTSRSHLDDFMDSLENLPDTLNQNFTLMHELDLRCQQLMNKIDKTAENYMSNVKEYSAEKINETMASIKQKFDTAKKFSDDKVLLSQQTYKLVDKQIRKLDLLLAQFNAEIQFKAEFRDAANSVTRHLPLTIGGSKDPSVGAVTDGTKPTNSIANIAVKTSSLNTGALVDNGVEHLTEVDMPIDPNEPTFCLCKQVSFGHMIGCDNPDCSIEWFHFECVNLITKPKGKWFCPKCITDKKK